MRDCFERARLFLSRRIEVEMNEIFSESSVNTIENKPVFYRLYDILQRYDLSFTNMLNLDRHHDACEILLTKSVPIWKRFARDTTDENEQKKHLYRALDLLEHLTEILAERWQLIRTITSHNDVSNASRCLLVEHSSFVLFVVDSHSTAHSTAVCSSADGDCRDTA